jgi:hypothetical protein
MRSLMDFLRKFIVSRAAMPRIAEAAGLTVWHVHGPIISNQLRYYERAKIACLVLADILSPTSRYLRSMSLSTIVWPR